MINEYHARASLQRRAAVAGHGENPRPSVRMKQPVRRSACRSGALQASWRHSRRDRPLGITGEDPPRHSGRGALTRFSHYPENDPPEETRRRILGEDASSALLADAAKSADRTQYGVVICLSKPKSVKPLATNCTASATSSRPINRIKMRMPVSPKYLRTPSAPASTK